MRYLIIGLLVIGVNAPLALAQGGYDGSIYSRYGIGEMHSFSSSQAQVLGGFGVALATPNYLTVANPAAWAGQSITRFSAGLDYQWLQATDASADRSRLNAGGLSSISLGLPLSANRFGWALAFQPFSRVGYRVSQEATLALPGVDDGVPYQIDYEGRGGLQQLVTGFGYRTGNLSIGGAVDVVFGVIDHVQRTSFQAEGYLPAQVMNSTRLWGVTGTAGVHYYRSRVFRSQDALSVGATVNLPNTLSGRQVRTVGTSLDQDTLGTTLSGNVSLPFRATVGAAYAPNIRWLFSTDIRYEAWSGFESDFALRGAQDIYRDRVRVGAGFQVLPAGADGAAPYFSRTIYRLGGYFEQSYFQLADGANLNTVGVTGGFSFPTIIPGTRLDLNLDLGTRGTTNHQLVRDLFYRITATINFGERWFVKRRLN